MPLNNNSQQIINSQSTSKKDQKISKSAISSEFANGIMPPSNSVIVNNPIPMVQTVQVIPTATATIAQPIYVQSPPYYQPSYIQPNYGGPFYDPYHGPHLFGPSHRFGHYGHFGHHGGHHGHHGHH
jgi:hypothetical protein